MQFSVARAEVAAQLGLEATNISYITLINRWLNITQSDICGAWRWEWLEGIESIPTQTDYTTGTVGAISDTATITFSAGPTASQANRWIQFSSTDDWYKITAHVAGAVTATIEPVYAQTDNLVAGTFTIRTRFYPFASTTEYIYSCKEAISQRPILTISAGDADLYIPFTTATATTVQKIYQWSRSATNNYLQFTPYPWPTSIELLEFNIYKKATDLSSDTDTPLFPDRFNSLWIDGAISYGMRWMDDSRAKDAKQDFWAKVQMMQKNDDTDIARFRRIKSIDEGTGVKGIIRFPPEYGDKYDY